MTGWLDGFWQILSSNCRKGKGGWAVPGPPPPKLTLGLLPLLEGSSSFSAGSTGALGGATLAATCTSSDHEPSRPLVLLAGTERAAEEGLAQVQAGRLGWLPIMARRRMSEGLKSMCRGSTCRLAGWQ